MPVLVARGENGEKFADERDILDLSDGLAPRMQIAALAERDQLLDDRAQILCLRQRGDDLLVLDERLAHIGKHRLAMFMRAAEAAFGVSVIHGVLRYYRGRRAKVRPRRLHPACFGREGSDNPISNVPRTAWRVHRYC